VSAGLLGGGIMLLRRIQQRRVDIPVAVQPLGSWDVSLGVGRQGLSYRLIISGQVSGAFPLFLYCIHLADPLPDRVCVEEPNSGAPGQLDGSLGVARRGHYPGLRASVVPCAGEDLLHRLVTDGPSVVLALNRDVMALIADDDIHALIPGAP
jgi:hypothetical protein